VSIRRLVLAVVVLGFFASSAHAVVLTDTYTIQELVDDHGGILDVAGRQFCFDENSVTTVVGGAAAGPDAPNIAVTGVAVMNMQTQEMEVGLRFNAGWSAINGGSVDTTIRFKAIANEGNTWTDNSMWLSAFGVTNDGLVQITENVWADDPSEWTAPRNIGNKQVYYLNDEEKKIYDHINFDVYGQQPPIEEGEPLTIWITKDIHVVAAPIDLYDGQLPNFDAIYGLDGIGLLPPSNVAGLSEFYQTFSQTVPFPEPATMGLMALGGAVLLRRRRRK